MENSKSPEKKGRKYFFMKIQELANEAKADGEDEIVTVLATLSSALLSHREGGLEIVCADFADRVKEQIRKSMGNNTLN